MKRRHFIQSVSTAAVGAGFPINSFASATETQLTMNQQVKRKIFINGGGGWKSFAKFTIALTKKENPRICFVPTATGDSLNSIANWYAVSEEFPMRPFLMKSFINSYETKKTFEETLLSMDAIVVGGGNTLNMMAIWKAQGIDVALRKAYDSGVLMSGGSAGSLCWFQSGTTDSRPIKLSVVECLGWLKGSHCPHYDAEVFRRPLYQELIKKGELAPGYACDNLSGIYFENEQLVKSVSVNKESKSYYVDLVDGQVSEKPLTSELIN
jgi:dipeptidase E